ncbi:MAG: HlyD family type I secretion periplasmic adaptor subunit, partial [Halobacteria archaeon]|nr:HlyD family type I secretion periplasmic adaptor subunit [Halobacteria archaeon]
MKKPKPLDSGIKIDEHPYRLLGWTILTITFVLMLGWSALAALDSAVVANGRIHVASLNKSVQHLDGGLVKTIAVQDGDLVEEGQLLLSLDRIPLEIKLENINEQLIETEASLERLAVERDALAALTFSDELKERTQRMNAQSILETQRQLFESRRQALSSEQAILRQRLVKTKQEINGTREMIRTMRNRLGLLNQDLTGLRKLVDKNFASKAMLREVQRQRSELQGKMISHEAEVSRLKSSLPEIRSQIELLENEYNKEVISSLRDFQTRRINLLAEQRTLEGRLSRIEIRAPVSGKIKGLDVVTQGAVIKTGITVMEIVPIERDFRIHARISPMDIDALYPGLKAEVRILVFEGSRYFPSLYADLEDISTDVYLEERSGDAYYKATLKVDRDSLAILEQENLKLVSGMPIEVVIKTGERTLLDY